MKLYQMKSHVNCIILKYFYYYTIIVYCKNCLSDGSYRGTKLIDLKAISDEAIGKCKDQ